MARTASRHDIVAAPAEGARSRGRPRNPEVDRRMKRAVLEALAENGFSHLTLEKVCAQANVTPATFYRRWDSPLEAAAEAFNEAFKFPHLPDTGDVVSDLTEFFGLMLAAYSDPVLGSCMAFLVPERRLNPGSHNVYYEGGAERRAAHRTIIQRAVSRGGIDLTIEIDSILDVLSGLAIQLSFKPNPTVAVDLPVIIRSLLNIGTPPP